MEIKVYETKKYSIFKKLEGNRDVYGVNKIIKSIEQVGYIPSPICVNDKMEVIDGQNRLEALKELGMPVHYYIVKDIGLEEARQMNIGRRNWSVLDYFKSHAAEGKEEYQYFLEILEKHNHYGVRDLWAIFSSEMVARRGVPESVKLGNLGMTIKDMKSFEPIIETLDTMYESLRKVPGYTGVAFPTFAWILQHPRVDKKRVVKIVNTKYPLFIPCVSADLLMKDFNKYYNAGLKAENKILFDVDYQLSKNKQ